MSLLKRGWESRAYPQFSQTTNPLNVMWGQTSVWSSAGERVDEQTALGVAAVFACVNLLSDSVASMSVRAYRDGDEIAVPQVIADPDPLESTQFDFLHQTMASLGLHGMAVWHVERASNGEPVGLTPLHPYQVNILPAKSGSGREFIHMGKVLAREDVVYIPWLSTPQSLRPVSPLAQERSTLGLALAMDRYLAQWYGEGGTPSGVLSTDRPLTAEAMRNLRESWESSQRKHRRPAVLADGLKWQPIQTSAVDMEFSATYDQLLQQIARIYRVPPHLINVKSASTDYANVEQSSINYLTYTLHPWLRRLEIAMSKVLPAGVEVRFDATSLLRLDALTKARVQMMQIQSGTRTPNEARAMDGLGPYEGGDEFVQVLPGAPMQEANVPTGTDSDPTTPVIASEEPREAVQIDVHNHLDGLAEAVRSMRPIVNVSPTVPSVNVQAPNTRTRRVERDDDGNITRIVEER